MKILSEEDLIDRLNKELAFRKKELTYIKSLIKSSQSGNCHHITRFAILILYAHWEGYVKYAARFYINFIRNKNLKYNELRENFVTLALTYQIQECGKSKKTSIHHQIVNLLLNETSSQAKIPTDEYAIAINSNLNYEMFLEILFIIGLDIKSFELKEKYIDEGLLNIRNSIAHGSLECLNFDDYFEWHDTILSLLEKFNLELSLAISEKRYLKPGFL